MKRYQTYLDKMVYRYVLCRLAWKECMEQEMAMIAVGLEGCFALAVSLPAVERLIFIRRYYYLDSTAEIAERYGLPLWMTDYLLRQNRHTLEHWMEE